MKYYFLSPFIVSLILVFTIPPVLAEGGGQKQRRKPEASRQLPSVVRDQEGVGRALVLDGRRRPVSCEELRVTRHGENMFANALEEGPIISPWKIGSANRSRENQIAHKRQGIVAGM